MSQTSGDYWSMQERLGHTEASISYRRRSEILNIIMWNNQPSWTKFKCVWECAHHGGKSSYTCHQQLTMCPPPSVYVGVMKRKFLLSAEWYINANISLSEDTWDSLRSAEWSFLSTTLRCVWISTWLRISWGEKRRRPICWALSWTVWIFLLTYFIFINNWLSSHDQLCSFTRRRARMGMWSIPFIIKELVVSFKQKVTVMFV